MVLYERSLLVLISTHEPLVIFSLPCLDVEGSRATLVGVWLSARVNPPHMEQLLTVVVKHIINTLGKLIYLSL